jgi:hypothetical protein
MFDWAALRAAYKSYVDSIVIELCLPNSQYPKYILARILEDATQEDPREKERFPQALFDALGDLSVSAHMVSASPLLTKDVVYSNDIGRIATPGDLGSPTSRSTGGTVAKAAARGA